jgi:EmrB/QacA subfamily drug resistance transporter
MTPVDQPLDDMRPQTPPTALAEARARPAWVVPIIIGTALFMQNMTSNIVSNALPAIGRALHEDPLRLNLTITMFTLAMAVSLPVSGWLADKVGAKKIFALAIVLFAMASVSCGFAQNLPQLVIARVFQGMAAAMMGPVGRLVLLRTTPKTELVSAMSLMTMPAVLGPMVGPILGGAIVTFADWRWIFFVNIPLAIVGLFLVLKFVPNVKEQEVSPIDILGIALTGVGLASFIFAFEDLGRDGLPLMLQNGLFLLAALSLTGYWLHARKNPHAIIDLSIFRVQTFRTSVVGGAFMRLAPGSLPFMLAMLLQVAFGRSAFEAGILTVVAGLGSLAMKTAAPPILRRYGFRTTLLVNGAIVAATFMAIALLKPTTPQWIIMAVLGAGGFFRSLQFTSLNGMAYAEIEQVRMSRASTTSAMMQQLTQSIAVGLAASLMHFFMVMNHEHRLTIAAIAPTFLVMGLLTLISMFYYAALPKNAGDEMNGRRTPT